VATGVVKSFNQAKRYGFIKPDLGGKDVFVHTSELQRSGLPSLRKGQKLAFEIAEVEGRPSARNLRTDGRTMTSDLNDEDQTAMKSGVPRIMNRKSITSDALQSIIAKNVRESRAECEGFLGIFIERVIPKARGGVNWTLRGVKYGKGDRTLCDAVLGNIIARLEDEYFISDEPK
jgi:CspA family cold shock protein